MSQTPPPTTNWTPPDGWNDYVTSQRRKAVAWKAATTDLPDQARAPGHYRNRAGNNLGPYPFCLPQNYATHNLLPDIRQAALNQFTRLDIPWHDSINGGPSNHLLDSQVQCANALTPMINNPDRIHAALGHTLGLGEVTPFDDGTYVTFEYIGDRDYLGESPNRPRRRGTMCTSVDAALQHTAPDGAHELILLEWKYTERYTPPNPRRARGNPTRKATYEKLISAREGPINLGALSVEALFDEPVYQLVRQQLLAHEIEQHADSGFDRVRVAHVLPPANAAYELSILNTSAASAGDSTLTAWQALLRKPHAFVHVDPDIFSHPDASGAAYQRRYGPTDNERTDVVDRQ